MLTWRRLIYHCIHQRQQRTIRRRRKWTKEKLWDVICCCVWICVCVTDIECNTNTHTHTSQCVWKTFVYQRILHRRIFILFFSGEATEQTNITQTECYSKMTSSTKIKKQNFIYSSGDIVCHINLYFAFAFARQMSVLLPPVTFSFVW